MRKTVGLSYKAKPMFQSSSPAAAGGRAIINNMYFVYAIYNKNAKKIYIGQTEDLEKRLKLHNEHIFSSYTSRFRGKWELIYNESVATRPEALIREKQLKSHKGRGSLKIYI